MNKVIRIGTRESRLALWQAEQVCNALNEQGQATQLVPIKSEGDLQLSKPLYELGITGIFTRALDAALLDKRIDLAVHSYKDVPTRLAAGTGIAAVMKRGNPFDMLIRNKSVAGDHHPVTIATSSLRRLGQWRHRYPGTETVTLRGNIQTRLQKLHQSVWHGAVFAAAAIERLRLDEQETGKQELLEWMLPAPAQGAIVIVARDTDKNALGICEPLHHHDTALCTHAEREFLRALKGGCSTPAGALAEIIDGRIHLKANFVSADGKEYCEIQLVDEKTNVDILARHAASSILGRQAKTKLPA